MWYNWNMIGHNTKKLCTFTDSIAVGECCRWLCKILWCYDYWKWNNRRIYFHKIGNEKFQQNRPIGTQACPHSCHAIIYLNSLRPSDAIWRQWSWTTLAQVMACCLTAPSHYLNQCWLIIRGVLWHSSENSFTGIAQGIDSGYEFEKNILKNIFKSPRGQWVKSTKKSKCIHVHYNTNSFVMICIKSCQRPFQKRFDIMQHLHHYEWYQYHTITVWVSQGWMHSPWCDVNTILA